MPPVQTILESRVFRWNSEDDCAAFAQRLAASPALADAFLTLEGGLGAGKTTLVRHLLRALGVQGRIKSPTYTVVEPHQAGDLSIAHFDFYRFDDPREWEDAGFRDLFGAPGLKLAEWPDKAAGQLPTPDLRFELRWPPAATECQREAEVQALTARGVELLKALGTS